MTRVLDILAPVEDTLESIIYRLVHINFIPKLTCVSKI